MFLRVFLAICLIMGFVLVCPMNQPSAQTSDTKTLYVTGQVLITPDDIQTSISSDRSEGSELNQDQTITYTITYGSTSTNATNLTLVASYDAFIDQTSSHVVDYVMDSASLAFGDTPAIFDPQQRTLTWEIPVLPANTSNQIVTFKLVTNSRFTDPSKTMPIIVKLRVTQPFPKFSQQVQNFFRFNQTLVPPPPTATPTNQPQSIVTKSVEPTTTVRNMIITQLNSRSITIAANTPNVTSLKLIYGQNPRQLTKGINSISAKGNHVFKLTNLTTDTTYYFQFVLPTTNNAITSKELYVLHTPNQTEELELRNTYRVSINSRQGPVFSGKLFTTQFAPPVILLPRSSTLQFNLQLDRDFPLTMADINYFDLDLTAPIGSMNSSASQGSQQKNMTADTFDKDLTFPDFLGNFLLKSRFETQRGTIAESLIANVQIIKPILIRHQRTGAPIPNAAVTIYKYDQLQNKFLPYPDTTKPPLVLYSEKDGSLPLIPQNGRFRLDIVRVPFYPKSVDLTMRLSQTMVLPDIELKPTVVSWLEPVANVLAYFRVPVIFNQISLQNWIDEWSEALIGRKLFPTQTEHITTTHTTF